MRPLDKELRFAIDRLFMIDNLSFLKYIGYLPDTKEIERHNRIVEEYKMPKIDPVKMEYVDKGDPRWLNL